MGTYGTWAEVISKAKEILDKGYGGDDFWCTEENGGYREENEDDFEDNTSAKEPKGKGTVELASAKHCEGDKGNMILQAQRQDEAAAPPSKRAKSAAGGTFSLTILTGWSSIETSTIVGVYATWAEVISKAKEILEKGNGMACDFWLPEDKGGFRYVEDEEEDYDDEFYQDKTDTAKEPTGKETVELATAQHCEGAKGNMILVAQRLTGVALA